ncbi:MAG: IclR family transcriptional regulator, partial [Magnetovibrio sp.]|nr:IclR family transcriptional regulator [Magnetovibrio sp.]
DYSTAIAVPVRNFTGEVVAAINISGIDAIMQKPGTQERLIKALNETAAALMNEIGGVTNHKA